jgi:hypothetical protein
MSHGMRWLVKAFADVLPGRPRWPAALTSSSLNVLQRTYRGDESRRPSAPPDPVSGPMCSECRSTKTAAVLRTTRGLYYRCRVCGYVWHEDSDAAPVHRDGRLH